MSCLVLDSIENTVRFWIVSIWNIWIANFHFVIIQMVCNSDAQYSNGGLCVSVRKLYYNWEVSKMSKQLKNWLKCPVFNGFKCWIVGARAKARPQFSKTKPFDYWSFKMCCLQMFLVFGSLLWRSEYLLWSLFQSSIHKHI